jgi:four helix bundle protein
LVCLSMQDFKKLLVWQKSFDLTISTYKLTSNYPSEEKYSLTSQTKRAVVSISNNIAEGCGRFTQNDLVHFLQMSLGSTNEVENCLLIAQALKYLSDDGFNNLNNQNTEIRKMLISLIEKIRKEK